MTYELRNALADQEELQVSSYGDKTSPREFDTERKIEFIMVNILALTDELHEALAEIGWKPWATSKHINQNELKKEMVDAFHFFMNILIAADIDADEFLAAYREKRERNKKRQADGYDGVSGKCPGCSRAADDVAVTVDDTAVRCICGVVYEWSL